MGHTSSILSDVILKFFYDPKYTKYQIFINKYRNPLLTAPITFLKNIAI
jgi:hypothetical protein